MTADAGKGIFITFEGPDGSGKTTQLRLLEEFLKGEGRSPLMTREPGGTPIGEKLREVILDRENREMDAVTEALLYAASRAQHVAQVIRPALEEGRIVICDRFVDSSIAYQAYGRGLGPMVETINQAATGGLEPDLTVLLMVEPETGRGRLCRENMDRLESESAAYHQKVFQGYEELARRFPDRILRVDGAGTIEEIHEEILRKVRERLGS